MFNISNENKNYRVHFEYPQKNKPNSIKKGKWTTLCVITDRDSGEEVSRAKVKYNSDEDKFDKALGRRIALSLAMEDVFDREFRERVWELYRSAVTEEEKKVFK